jgi:hypothetical protein
VTDRDTPTREYEWYLGVTVDHLYQNCPNLQRAVKAGTPAKYPDLHIGEHGRGWVDPKGFDLCGLCQRRYERGQHD